MYYRLYDLPAVGRQKRAVARRKTATLHDPVLLL
jgi:hypothetical protein